MGFTGQHEQIHGPRIVATDSMGRGAEAQLGCLPFIDRRSLGSAFLDHVDRALDGAFEIERESQSGGIGPVVTQIEGPVEDLIVQMLA